MVWNIISLVLEIVMAVAVIWALIIVKRIEKADAEERREYEHHIEQGEEPLERKEL